MHVHQHVLLNVYLHDCTSPYASTCISKCTLQLHVTYIYTYLYMYMYQNTYGCSPDTDHYSSGCFQGVRRGQGVLLPNDDVFLCLLRGADVGLVLRGGHLLPGLVLYALPARVRHQHGLLPEAVRCLRAVRVRAALRDVRTLLEQDWNKLGDS